MANDNAWVLEAALNSHRVPVVRGTTPLAGSRPILCQHVAPKLSCTRHNSLEQLYLHKKSNAKHIFASFLVADYTILGMRKTSRDNA